MQQQKKDCYAFFHFCILIQIQIILLPQQIQLLAKFVNLIFGAGQAQQVYEAFSGFVRKHWCECWDWIKNIKMLKFPLKSGDNSVWVHIYKIAMWSTA